MANEKDYMPTEVGLAQGAQGDQVERLQEYLRRYGYTESPVPESFGMETVPGLAAPLQRKGASSTRTPARPSGASRNSISCPSPASLTKPPSPA